MLARGAPAIVRECWSLVAIARVVANVFGVKNGYGGVKITGMSAYALKSRTQYTHTFSTPVTSIWLASRMHHSMLVDAVVRSARHAS